MSSNYPCTAEVEAQRLTTLAGFDLLDTPHEAEFYTVVALACRLFDCPIATITLVDDHRQWFKAKRGLDGNGCPREQSICAVAIYEPDMLVVEDLRLDPRFADNPIVVGHPHARFYAGVPLCLGDLGEPGIGTLCVIGTEPRRFAPADASLLRDLGGLVCAIIRARRSAAATLRLSDEVRSGANLISQQNAQLRQAERMVGVGSWRLDLRDQSMIWSDQVFAIHGLPVGEIPDYDTALSFYPPTERTHVSACIDRAASKGEAFDFESDFITATGVKRRVRSMGEAQITGGSVVALTGVFQDVTERYEREHQLRKTAGTDALTGLANRRSFEKRLNEAFEHARDRNEPLALLMLDLDGFKAVNDTLGHGAGDEVLGEVARRLRTPMLGQLFAARLGGDEFVLLVTRPRDCADLETIIQTTLGELRYAVTRSGHRLPVSATIGAALLDNDVQTSTDLLHRADLALYAAKKSERGTGRVFGESSFIWAVPKRPLLMSVA